MAPKKSGGTKRKMNESKNELLYEVEKIMDERLQGKKVEYLVKWKDYSFDEMTWELRENIVETCRDLIEQFEALYYVSADAPSVTRNGVCTLEEEFKVSCSVLSSDERVEHSRPIERLYESSDPCVRSTRPTSAETTIESTTIETFDNAAQSLSISSRPPLEEFEICESQAITLSVSSSDGTRKETESVHSVSVLDEYVDNVENQEPEFSRFLFSSDDSVVENSQINESQAIILSVSCSPVSGESMDNTNRNETGQTAAEGTQDDHEGTVFLNDGKWRNPSKPRNTSHSWKKLMAFARCLGLATRIEDGQIKVTSEESDGTRAEVHVLDQGCEIEILGAKDEGGIELLVEWRNRKKHERIQKFVPSAEARQHIPLLLIKFYEKHSHFVC